MLSEILDLFFPRLCNACLKLMRSRERMICTKCRDDLPQTEVHFYHQNLIKKIFFGRLNLEAATALFYFKKKSPVQTLIHGLKYRGYEEIGTELGMWLGAQLKSIPTYQSVDMVVPVPIHAKRLRQRGYNQTASFAIAIAAQLNSEYNDTILYKTKDISSQINKTKSSRWVLISDAFSVKNPEKIKGKHLLLVDDLITTGATIEACGSILCKITAVKLSVVSIAIAHSIFR